jgi:hypothetical protein
MKVSIQVLGTCTRVAVGGITFVHGLQWAQSNMYVGCSGHSHIYLGCIEAQSRMYAGCSKVNAYNHTRFSG